MTNYRITKRERRRNYFLNFYDLIDIYSIEIKKGSYSTGSFTESWVKLDLKYSLIEVNDYPELNIELEYLTLEDAKAGLSCLVERFKESRQQEDAERLEINKSYFELTVED